MISHRFLTSCALGVVAAVAINIPVPAAAQSSSAAVRATVVDPQGYPVSGALVVIINAGTNQRRDATSSGDGRVGFVQLQPADYVISAEAPGFGAATPVALTLNVGDERLVKLALRLATLETVVEVQADAPGVQGTPAVGTVISRDFIANMPLSGRTLQSLFDLTPGVMRTSPGTGGQFVVNGQRPDANYFLVDGVSANVNVSAFTAAPGVAGTQPSLSVLNTTNTLVSIDALQEFKIMTSTYAPEFGRTAGGQISLVTRSGSNTFTGTAFEYFRHEAMEANDWFAARAGLAKPPTRQHAFGGVLGGPLRLPGYDGRNRSFFFFSYEGLRLKQPQVANTLVPSLAARAAATGAMRSILDVWPLPTGEDLVDAQGRPTGAAVYRASFADPSEHDTVSLRVDQAMGTHGALFARVSAAPSSSIGRTLGMAYLRHTERRTDALTVGYTWASRSRLTNDVRVNLTNAKAGTRNTLDRFGGAIPVDPALVFPSFATPETASMTFQMNFGDLFPSFAMGTTSANSTRQLNIVDNVVVQAGQHSFKFGADYRRQAVDLAANASISPNFPTLDAFYAGVVPSLSVTGRQSNIVPIVENVSLYAQDTWQASPRLTLTYGARWDVNPAPAAPADRGVMTVIGIESPETLDVAPAGTPLFPTRYDNIAPRLGATYQLRQHAGWETVLRGGAGLYYDLGTTVALIGYEGYPYRITVDYPNVAYPLGSSAAVVEPAFVTTPPYTTAYGFAPDFVSPRTWQWSATVDQALGRHQSISVAYVGAAGRKLTRTEAFTRPNPRFSDSVRVTRNTASSDYKSLQVQYTQRPFHGLHGMAAYTWSHSTDTASTGSIGNFIPIVFATLAANRADSDFDVRHNLAASISYTFPTPPGPRLMRAAFGGFAIDTLVKARSAAPVDILGRGVGVPFNGTLRPNLVAGQPLYLDDPAAPGGRRVNRAAFELAPVAAQGSVPRNFLRGFGARQVDLALRRDIPVSAGVRLQLRADVFNVFNTPNFGNPTASISSPQFGVATAMLNRSLNGLNALYEMGGPRSAQLAVKVLF